MGKTLEQIKKCSTWEKHLKIIAGCGDLDECCGFPLPRGTQPSFLHEL